VRMFILKCMFGNKNLPFIAGLWPHQIVKGKKKISVWETQSISEESDAGCKISVS
jgi:hypothetical protein